MRASYDSSASILLHNLHWDNLSLRCEKLKAGLMFKTLNGNTPSYLQDMFSVRGTGYNIINFDVLPEMMLHYRSHFN